MSSPEIEMIDGGQGGDDMRGQSCERTSAGKAVTEITGIIG